MASALDTLGSLLSGGMTKSTPDRIERSLSDRGVGGKGGFLDQILGGSKSPASRAEGGGTSTALQEMIGSIFSDPRALKVGGLGALAGAILGRGAKGAVGGGALALLGSLALKALQKAGSGGQGPQLDPSTQLSAGLRPPANDRERERVESQAELLVAAMVNAAKADGQIDQREIERIAGKLEADDDSRMRLMQDLRKPMDTDRITRAVTNPQMAAQVYAASLLAINVDTEAEREYLADLAAKLRLDPAVVQQLHEALGV